MSTDLDTLGKIIEQRRSVRLFDATIDVPPSTIRACLSLAQLAPNSSNLQLWEFYHICEGPLKDRLAKACMNQNAAKSAKTLIIFVTRRDFWRKHAKLNAQFMESQLGNADPKTSKLAMTYYQKLIPFLYMQDPFGLMTLIRRIASAILACKGPSYRQVGGCDQRVIAHKSCALAAENFMLAIKAAGFDSCPMEGFDSKRLKSLLKLPKQAEINMVVGVGKGLAKGIYGPRFRIPFEQVYRVIH